MFLEPFLEVFWALLEIVSEMLDIFPLLYKYYVQVIQNPNGKSFPINAGYKMLFLWNCLTDKQYRTFYTWKFHSQINEAQCWVCNMGTQNYGQGNLRQPARPRHGAQWHPEDWGAAESLLTGHRAFQDMTCTSVILWLNMTLLTIASAWDWATAEKEGTRAQTQPAWGSQGTGRSPPPPSRMCSADPTRSLGSGVWDINHSQCSQPFCNPLQFSFLMK
jgi:hypothetical protein